MNLRLAPARFDAALHQVWQLPAAEVLRGRRALWWSAGPAGELAVLLVHRRHLHRSRIKGWTGWDLDLPFTGELLTLTGSQEQRTVVKDIRMRPSHLALLPDSRFLLVGGRTRLITAESVWKPNAVLFSPAGVPEAEFCVGDDIPALVTDSRGGIWTAYGDEGIYGAHDESAAGLAGWDTQGRPIWAPAGRLPDHPLEGCTAAPSRTRTVSPSAASGPCSPAAITTVDPPNSSAPASTAPAGSSPAATGSGCPAPWSGAAPRAATAACGCAPGTPGCAWRRELLPRATGHLGHDRGRPRRLCPPFRSCERTHSLTAPAAAEQLRSFGRRKRARSGD